MSNHARSENLAIDLARATHIHICNVYPYICSIVIHGEYLILINLTKTLAAVCIIVPIRPSSESIIVQN